MLDQDPIFLQVNSLTFHQELINLSQQKYWALQPGNETLDWTDARLTELGIDQARIVNAFWKRKMADENIPLPESYYTSPLHRCLATATHTFADLDLPEDKPFKPIVKEVSEILLPQILYTATKSILLSSFAKLSAATSATIGAPNPCCNQNFPPSPSNPAFTNMIHSGRQTNENLTKRLT